LTVTIRFLINLVLSRPRWFALRKSPLLLRATVDKVLFHRHALGKVARFIDVTAKLDGKMIGEKLKRNDREYRHDAIRRFWQGDNFVGDFFELLRAISAGECNNGAFTSLDLLDVIQIFREDRIVGHDKNRGKIRADQRHHAVLELGARVS